MLSWYGIPKELDPELQAFMRENELSFSSGYIGMLRCYWKGNSVVWQTNAAWFLDQKPGSRSLPSGESLAAGGIAFLSALKALPKEELRRRLVDTDVPLISELDLRRIDERKRKT